MRKFLFLCILITLTGCDRWFDAAYTFGSVSTYEGDGEIRALCKHLSGLAAAHDLVKREAVRDSTLCVYSDSEHMFLVLGARSLNGQLVVDVQALNSTGHGGHGHGGQVSHFPSATPVVAHPSPALRDRHSRVAP